MTKAFPVLASLAAAASLFSAPVLAGQRMTGEQELARLLEGRTAGDAKMCLRTSNGTGTLSIIDRTALVYKQGGKVWVNRTTTPEGLRDDDIMLIEHFGTSDLCRHDVIKMLDRSTGMMTGLVFLDDFVPYEKTAS